jgi:hypothetical protein
VRGRAGAYLKMITVDNGAIRLQSPVWWAYAQGVNHFILPETRGRCGDGQFHGPISG